MISLKVFLVIVIFHWIADFIFQDERWATTKSKSFKSLIKHTAVYASIWIIGALLMFPETIQVIYFVLITLVMHTVVDYFSSKIVSKQFNEKKLGGPIPNIGAFSTIGLDQVVHYIQLVLTYLILVK